MTLWLDAALAYLHFIAIFVLFAFLTVEAVLVRRPLDARLVHLLGRIDRWYFGAAIAVLVTGFLRLAFGAKGADYYLQWWPIYVKVLAFLAVGMMSVYPTMAFIRWRRAIDDDPAWTIPDVEQRGIRRLVMIEVHVLALVPIAAVILSRGLGR